MFEPNTKRKKRLQIEKDNSVLKQTNKILKDINICLPGILIYLSSISEIFCCIEKRIKNQNNRTYNRIIKIIIHAPGEHFTKVIRQWILSDPVIVLFVVFLLQIFSNVMRIHFLTLELITLFCNTPLLGLNSTQYNLFSIQVILCFVISFDFVSSNVHCKIIWEIKKKLTSKVVECTNIIHLLSEHNYFVIFLLFSLKWFKWY